MKNVNLLPRAVAVLVALRRGDRTTAMLADAIADRGSDTQQLLESMAALELIERRSLPTSGVWFRLAEDGKRWLCEHEGPTPRADAATSQVVVRAGHHHR